MGLTVKQEAFCKELILNGLSQRQSYVKAYVLENKPYRPADIDTRACLLAKNPKIEQRCAELREKLEKKALKKAIYSRDKALEDLVKIIEEGMGAVNKQKIEGKVVEKMEYAGRHLALRGIEMISKMEGFNAPEKVESDLTVVFDIPRPFESNVVLNTTKR